MKINKCEVCEREPRHDYDFINIKAYGVCIDCNMPFKNKKPTTRAEARQYAIDWQNWASEQSLSYAELADWSNIFTDLAVRFDLKDEFIENGII